MHSASISVRAFSFYPVVALIAVILSLMPLMASAQTADDYGTGSSTRVDIPSYCPKLTKTVQFGTRDPLINRTQRAGSVTELQKFLGGYFDIPADEIVSGYFGRVTEGYVIQFQKDMGLPALGIAGQLTRGAIAQACTGSTPVENVITVTAPNGGEKFAKGDTFTARWRLSGRYPVGTQICINLTNQSIQLNSVPFYGTTGTEHCATVDHTKNSQEGVVSGQLGNHITAGMYKARAFTFFTPNQYKPELDVWDESDAAFYIGDTASSSGIRITAPNGGENWEIGQLSTITWTPYSYTPTTVNGSNQVSVYLEKTDGTRVGKIMDTGKASLHTYFNIDNYEKWATPGTYYVRAVNEITGATDRSDAPFTLLGKSVDLKVNGVDSGAVVSDSQKITLTWTVANHPFGTCAITGIRSTPGGNVTSVVVSTSGGSMSAYAYAPYPGAFSTVQLDCAVSGGVLKTDYASIQASGTAGIATVKVVSPNGSEKISVKEPLHIRWSQSQLKTVSIALYRNDQWQEWIVKDYPVSAKDIEIYSWAPSLSSLSKGYAEFGSVFKIYITGVRANGDGYVDDKSDATFSFVDGSTTPSYQFPMSTNKPSYTMGENVSVNWGGHGATNAQDWVALVSAGKKYTTQTWGSNVDKVSWGYTGASYEGPISIASPKTAGTYEAVYYTNNGFTEVARSQSFTVIAKTPTLVLAKSEVYIGDASIITPESTEADAKALCDKNAANNPGKKVRCLWNGVEYYTRPATTTPTQFPISVDKTSYKVGESISIKWGSNSAATAQDWIAVVPAGKKYTAQTWGSNVDGIIWQYTNGSVGPLTLAAPKTAGSYEVVYYINNGFTEAARGLPFTVVASTPTPQPQGAAAVSAWTKQSFSSTGTTSCTGDRYVGFSAKYNAWIGAIQCGSNMKYKLYMSESKTGTYYQIADENSHGGDHCELVNSKITKQGDEFNMGTLTGSIVDVQNETVFVRNEVGESFKKVTSRYWADLTTDQYMCGVAIGSAPVALVPSCSITSNKSSYTVGEVATFSWTSKNASYGAWVPDTSGKDNLVMSGDKLAASGKQNVTINVSGNPFVTMDVFSATGEKATCSKTIPVAAAPAYTIKLTASPSTIYAGQTVKISWTYTGAQATTPKDWIVAVPQGTKLTAENYSKYQWFYTDGATTGSKNITLPAGAAIYDVVYLSNDGYSELKRQTAAISVEEYYDYGPVGQTSTNFAAALMGVALLPVDIAVDGISDFLLMAGWY